MCRVGRWSTILLLLTVCVTLTGCQGMRNRRVAMAPEPALTDPSIPGEPVVVAPPSEVSSMAFVDRHPMFSKPRDMYNSDPDGNKLLRTTKAAFVGVPMGIVGEVRQIVVGAPQPVPEAPY